MNRKVPLLIIICFILLTVTSCNNSTDELLETDNTCEELLSNSEPTKLTYFMYINDDDFKDIRTEIEKTCPLNIRLDIQYTKYMDMHDRVQKAIAANEQFDGFSSLPLYSQKLPQL